MSSSVEKSIIPRKEYIKSINGEIFLTYTEVPAGLGAENMAASLLKKTGH